MNEEGTGGPSAADAVDRLRAADPAAGARVDLDRLRAAVDARMAGDAPAATPTAPPALADRRARARRGWARVAAVAAGVAVVGAAGFGLGRTTGETAVPGDTAGGAEPALDGTDLRGAAVAPEIWPGPGVGGRTTFTGAGLSDAAGTAPAWAFDAAAAFTAERVAAAAAALGVTGEPRLQDGVWQVGPQDGSGPSISVHADGQAGLSYHDPAAEPVCEATGGAVECVPRDTGPAPDPQTATDEAEALLAALGLDGFEYEVPDLGHGPAVSVIAHLVRGGGRTGVAWYLTVTGAGVAWASGPLAPLTELGTYPVVSPAEAVGRLNDPRFGVLGGFSIMAAEAGGAGEAGPAREGRPVPDPAAPAAPEDPSSTALTAPDAPVAAPGGGATPPPPAVPGEPVAWPVRQVTITGARLAVAPYTTPSGTALLVPAYELTADTGESWSVLALTEEALDLTP
ncbi:hypothetical protein [Georgenia sp. AZ-5]|uniref:hypothetical protein n=1 Tax=Georgenia sp. AZ-5 TaxID=3367526 RepID=UPI0037545122